MGQENRHAKDEEQTGSDLPNSDGTVSDEDVNAVSGGRRQQKTGQDHSLDDYEETLPTDGVGGVQDSSDTTSDVARISD